MKTEAELIGYGLTGAGKIDSNHLNIALFSFAEILSEVVNEAEWRGEEESKLA
ncbi:hypothetical protein QUA56_29325 [Microcoleus sp. N3A4]|uniref:hypothetical protein n=1 Tax=Microcoleus sp. N3A4 TaxID=3055379 RepID=UPI002FD031F1